MWSDVLATRKAFDGLLIRRTRQCGNQHRFSTYEIHAVFWTFQKARLREAMETVKRRWALWARNATIRAELKSGLQGKDLAVKYGVSKSLISLIKKEKL